jgi:tRNA (cytidine56-2'-O)-methyltransferase
MISVLRLGHRVVRDARMSTHVGLVARAFGADSIVYSGDDDPTVMDSVRRVVGEWGGPFEVRYEKGWRRVIENFDGVKVHLTMYGEPFEGIVETLKGEDLLVIVGGEKVPAEVYRMVHYNLAIGNQPHSEVAALAVFLYELGGLKGKFEGARREVMPQKRGKKVTEKQ